MYREGKVYEGGAGYLQQSQGLAFEVVAVDGKQHLGRIVGSLQIYARLAELELSDGEVPKMPGKGYVALPEDTADRARERAEKEGERAAFMENIVSFNRELVAALAGQQGRDAHQRPH